MSYCYFINIINKAIQYSLKDKSNHVKKIHIKYSLNQMFPEIIEDFEEYHTKEINKIDRIIDKQIKYIHEILIRNYLGYGRGTNESIEYLIEFDIWYNNNKK
jgi:hypothetical protein